MSGYETAAETISLDLLHQGDRAEFSRLVETYSPVIYRLVLRMLANQQDAEDALQETFINAYRGVKNFDGRSSLSTWLYRIAVNEALLTFRRNKLITISIDEPYESEEAAREPLQIVDWCCLPEKELMSSEARAHLNQAIETLSTGLKIVFVLRDLEGLSTAQTGEILNLSETAVKTRLSRARLRLRELLTEYFGDRLYKKVYLEEESA